MKKHDCFFSSILWHFIPWLLYETFHATIITHFLKPFCCFLPPEQSPWWQDVSTPSSRGNDRLHHWMMIIIKATMDIPLYGITVAAGFKRGLSSVVKVEVYPHPWNSVRQAPKLVPCIHRPWIYIYIYGWRRGSSLAAEAWSSTTKGLSAALHYASA